MASRLQLQSLLETLLGSKNVYFNPPESLKMQYPCIRYERSDIKNTSANNSIYKQDIQYTITVIDRHPDSEITKKVSMIPGIRFNRPYTSDNLHHDVFTLFF